MTDAAYATHDAEPVTLDARPKGRYHSDQITAHWTVVFLVLFQFLTGSAMSLAYEVTTAANALPADGIIVVHGLIGSSILVAMLWRLALRIRHGAPHPPQSLSRPLQIVSRANHYAFYAVLIGMPLFGMAALWLKWDWLGVAHAWASYALIGLVALHLSGVVVHLIKRDGTVKRMGRGNVYP